MEIFIQVVSRDDGSSAWYTDTGRESWLTSGKDLWCLDSPFGEYERGSAFKTVLAAKKTAKEAKDLASWDGMVDVEVRFWRYVGGNLVRTKFTRDGKIKK